MEISRMILAACPPVYTLPGTWNDPDKIAKCMDTLIPHANLGQGAAFGVFLGVFGIGLLAFAIYITFGKKQKA